MTEIIEIHCPKCPYSWTPRVKNPKECPRCKQRLDITYDRKEATDGADNQNKPG